MRLFFISLVIVLAGTLYSQELWNPVEFNKREETRIKVSKFDFYKVDLTLLKESLTKASNEFQRDNQGVIIEIPMAGKSPQRFRVKQTNTIHESLRSKYPGIDNFVIQSVDNPRIHGRIDYTYQGFHAIIKDGSSTTFIDPAFEHNGDYYMVYTRREAINTKSFECYFSKEDDFKPYERMGVSFSDNMLRTYRLALSCTGEYAQFHGGTTPLVLSAMNTTINRVNFVYELEYGVRFEIIPNTDVLIYLNPITDPYDNDDIGKQLDQNQIECDTKIGAANYDIGHIFSTGGGGLAGYAVVCKNNKAWGGTGSSKPINDPFDIDYVAHEIGHQLSGSHTQNNSCNRDNSACYEPGSASTIMGYAGICSPNVQNNSDAYFHGYSIQEMSQYIVSDFGNQCPTKIQLDGVIPTITTSTGNHTIPKLTPFELKAEADGDSSLIYQWDQLDKGIGETQPPKSTNKISPLFRSYWGNETGVRTFPAINYIVNNTNNIWEVLPGVKRDLNFILTVKENKAGGANHVQAKNKLAVDNNSGPFLVTYPNQKYITWFVGEQKTITWDVANTDKSPVNCKNVDILISEDGGYTYPHLLGTFPNIGHADITVHDIEGQKIRVKIAASDNVFFDISNEDMVIRRGLPPFGISMDVNPEILCKGDSLEFYVRAISPDTLTDTVSVSINNPNTGLKVSFDSEKFLDNDSIRVTIYNEGAATKANVIDFFFTANGHTIFRQVQIQTYSAPSAPTLYNPVNFSENVTPGLKFVWNAVTGQPVTYDLEVATDIDFFNIVAKRVDVELPQAVLAENLADNTVYFWRVKANGVCESSPYSGTYVIRTGQCNAFYSTPGKVIELSGSFVSDTITVDSLPFEKLQSLEVIGLKGHTSNIGSIKASLVNADQKSSILWQSSCSGEKEMRLRFSDNAYSESIPCDTLDQVFGLGDLSVKPVESLSRFNSSTAENTYALVLSMEDSTTTGQMQQWGLNLCGSAPTCKPLRIPTTSRLYTADLACTDDEGWTHYSITAANNSGSNVDLMVMSIKYNGADPLPADKISVRIPTSARYIRINNAQYVANPANWVVLNRHWLLDQDFQVGNPVDIRFYLTDLEINSMLDAAGLSGQTDSLKVFSVFSNDSINASPAEKHLKVKPNDVKEHTYVLGTYNLNKYLQFSLDYLTDGCVGAGSAILNTNATRSTGVQNIRIFPNPGIDKINIWGINEKTRIEIYDINGRLQKSDRVSGDTVLDLSGLTAGTYLVRLVNNIGQYFEKVNIIK
ncbi:MAG: T9SS type A sorting domain-containing protein [Saprospiraceae bacterium]|nr:T9SS type A sorting domain-containing protein [Candidatus Parvibacillus calidus]